MLGAILGEPPSSTTSALGARAGGGASVLQRHEGPCVRAPRCRRRPTRRTGSWWPAAEALATASARSPRSSTSGARCTRASFDDDAPEATPVELACERWSGARVVGRADRALEPAGCCRTATRVRTGTTPTAAATASSRGGRPTAPRCGSLPSTARRHPRTASGSSGWRRRRRPRTPVPTARRPGGWLAPEVTLHDPPAPRASGVEAVAPRLVRWGARFRGRAHAVSRAVHVGGGWTQLHLVGSWPEAEEVGDGEGDGDGAGAGSPPRAAAGAGDEAATLVLLQERLLWQPDGRRAARRLGRAADRRGRAAVPRRASRGAAGRAAADGPPPRRVTQRQPRDAPWRLRRRRRRF